MTIVSLLDVLSKLENNLGKLFGEANLSATTDKLEYGEDLEDFKKELWWGKTSWKNTYLDLKHNKKNYNHCSSIRNNNVTGATKTCNRAYPLKKYTHRLSPTRLPYKR